MSGDGHSKNTVFYIYWTFKIRSKDVINEILCILEYTVAKKKQAIESSRELIEDEDFKGRHRETQKDFTRVRSLPFALVLVLVMRKSMKSLLVW